MLRAALCVLPHSESEVYYVEANATGRQPSGTPAILFQPVLTSLVFPIHCQLNTVNLLSPSHATQP